MILCAGNIESFPYATPIGVGLTQSAIHATRLCLMNLPSELIFIGSAGSYGKYKIFDIVTSSKGCNIENGYFQGQSYTPIDNVITASENADEPLVNSSNYITASKDCAKEFLSRGIELENMEFYSILAVAREFNLPVKGIFIVTNFCYEDAHKEFLANHNEAMRRLDEYIKARI